MNVNLEAAPYISNPLISPLIQYNNKIVSTFNELPANGKVFEVAIRIVALVVAPLAYLALSVSALIGIALHSRLTEGNVTKPDPFQNINENKVTISNLSANVPQDSTLPMGDKNVTNESLEEIIAKEDLEEMVAKEGIDLNKFIEMYKGKDGWGKYLDFEGKDLVEALAIAKKDKSDKYYGADRIKAALLAMKALYLLIESKIWWLQNSPEQPNERYLDTWGDNQDMAYLCMGIEALYLFAKRGKGPLVIPPRRILKASIDSPMTPHQLHSPFDRAIHNTVKEADRVCKDGPLKSSVCDTLNVLLQFFPVLLHN